MRNPVVRLVDLGYDDGFGKAMSFAQSLLASINVSGHRADVEYIRTNDLNLVARSMTLPARLIHVMAHGYDHDGQPGFAGTDGDGEAISFLGLHDLADFLQHEGEGIEASAILADCCGSAQERFRNALRHSLEQDVAFIGATRSVDWHECTTFASILYGSMLRAKGKGFDAADWVYDSAERSISAYEEAVDGRCPFAVHTLKPSRSASSAFTTARRGRGLT